MPAGGSAEQADVNSSLNALKILSCKTDKEKKGMKKERKRRKMKRMVLGHHTYLYVTPWVPRVLGLKQRDEVIIMNLGRDGGTHVNCHVMVM